MKPIHQYHPPISSPGRGLRIWRHGVWATLPFIALGLWGLGCADGTTGTTNKNNNNTSPHDGGTGSLELGYNCSFSSECRSALCLGVGQELLCSQPCATNPCPLGSYCASVDVQTAPAGEPVPPSGFYCLPDRGGLCKPCGSDINCTFAGDRCLDLGAGLKVCGRDCSFDGSCPVGYECRQGQCWPVGNTCECSPDRVGATRACQNMNEFGVCLGTQTCDASGWEPCSAAIPTFEVCNGVDDNCDGRLPTDEQDADDNGTIDCLENCTPSTEVCDAQDNDCNGSVDEGDPVTLCGTVPNGATACLHGECVIGSCEGGWVDVDGDFQNGCECQLTVTGGPTCDQAETVGPLSDAAGGQTVTLSGILQESEERWYQVQAVDSPDVGANGCDAFHFRTRITTNPAASYKFDVLADHCAGDAECPQSVTDFQWYTNFRDGTDPNILGECPCAEAPGPGMNQCMDNSRIFLVRLFRIPGSTLTCEPYAIEFSNGVFPAPL